MKMKIQIVKKDYIVGCLFFIKKMRGERMERTEVSSSNIESIGYDESKEILEIEFKRGNIYQYKGVPDNIFQNLLRAGSHGKYFNVHIKDKYPTIKIN